MMLLGASYRHRPAQRLTSIYEYALWPLCRAAGSRNGWAYGPVKDADAKTRPCGVPYEELPVEQHRKHVLFKAIVAALTVG
jgi:hypothetical protein